MRHACHEGAGECVADGITSGGILSSPVIAIVASTRELCSFKGDCKDCTMWVTQVIHGVDCCMQQALLRACVRV